MSWKISVALPVPQFNRQKKIFTTLSGNVTSGAVIATNDSSVFLKLLPGDIVKIGPSTYAGSEGKYEYGKVSSIAAGSITLIDNLTNDYKSTDPVEAYSSANAQGWVYYDTFTTAVVLQYWNATKLGSGGTLQKGYLNNFGAQYVSKASGGTAGALYMHSTIPYSLERNYTYRLGGYFKNSGFTSNINALRLYQDDSYPSALVNVDINNSYVDFTKAEDTGTTSSLTPSNEPATVLITHDVSSTFTTFAHDCIYLTHAMNTDGEASGVYTIPINPSFSPIRIDSSHLKVLQGSAGKDIIYGSLLETQVRGYTLRFNLGNKTMLNNLAKLLYFQNLGYRLMLESDIASEKPLFGYMNYRFSYVHWDENVIEIDVSFVGV